jgi:hypothetical protein
VTGYQNFLLIVMPAKGCLLIVRLIILESRSQSFQKQRIESLENIGSHRPNISSVISDYKQPSKSAQSIEITGFIEKSKPPEIIFFYTLLTLTA